MIRSVSFPIPRVVMLCTIALSFLGCGDASSTDAPTPTLTQPKQIRAYQTAATDATDGSQTIVYRVNAGGPSLDGTPAWQADTFSSPSGYVNWGTAGNSVYSVTHAVNVSDASLPPSTPEALFQTERYDPETVPYMEWRFPVSPGTYEVRLFFAEIYYGNQATGARVFDVSIDGTRVLDDFDAYTEVGGYAGVMKSFLVPAGEAITITLSNVVRSTAIKGIEIVHRTDDTLGADPMALHFPSTTVGQSSQETLTLTNLGDARSAAITIDTISLSGSEASAFTADFAPLEGAVLNAGQSVTATVTFTPLFGGAHTAKLRVDHSGLNTPFIVGLDGAGAEEASGAGTIVYRVNAGGTAVAASDDGPDWAADSQASPSPYVNAAGTGNAVYTVTTPIDTSDPSIATGTPATLFQSERWDPGPGPEMLWRFPVSGGDYEVRLYFGEIYEGAFSSGARVFSVKAENTSFLVDLDVYQEVGGYKGVVKSFTVSSDATLDLEFLHVAENPAVKAIEIIDLGETSGGGGGGDPSTSSPPIYRINVGGPELAASDGGPIWAADTSSYPRRESNAWLIDNHVYSTTRTISVSDPSVPTDTPAAVFQTERYNPYSSPEMAWHFAVSAGSYEVRLYLAEIYQGNMATGMRVFDVDIEGAIVFDNVDVFATVGGDKGLVKSAVVTSDELLTVRLLRGVGSPALKAVEIVPVEVPQTATSHIKVNHIQMLASHNAYHIEPPDPQFEFMKTTMPPLEHQLSTNGMRGFELDVHYDGYTLYVFHLPGIDEETHCYLLADCLATMLDWSNAYPAHHPIVFFFEMKDMTDAMTPLRVFSTAELVEALEQAIRANWPNERMITPDEVRYDYIAGEWIWPSLESARGKAIFVMFDHGKPRNAYTYGYKTLSGRAMFVTDYAGGALSPVLSWDNPYDSAPIHQGVYNGKLVRTRADALPGQWSDWNQRYAAYDSGAQMVFTDYPDPSMLEGYEVVLPDGTPSRCNPIIAPLDCTNGFVESLGLP